MSNRAGGPVRWELSGNHPGFKTQTETIPVDEFSQRGSSWSGTDVVRFPNQIEWSSIGELESAASAPPGVKLMEAALNGVCGEQPYEIAVDVRLFSEAPVYVSASDAQRIIILDRADLLQPYAGGGKYAIRAPDGATSAP